jgi:hypothetical protein
MKLRMHRRNHCNEPEQQPSDQSPAERKASELVPPITDLKSNSRLQCQSCRNMEDVNKYVKSRERREGCCNMEKGGERNEPSIAGLEDRGRVEGEGCGHADLQDCSVRCDCHRAHSATRPDHCPSATPVFSLRQSHTVSFVCLFVCLFVCFFFLTVC